jgi:hypothetical protein
MSMTSSRAANAATASLAPADRAARAGKILLAGNQLLPFLQRARSTGAADLHGAWKGAYEASEVAQIQFRRKLGAAISSRVDAPQAGLAMLTKVVSLVPTHTREGKAVMSRLIGRHPMVDVTGRV